MKIGEIRYNKLGTPMRIVEIRSNEDITIEFLDLHNMKKKTTYSNFKNGGIKNPYDRSLKGVGYLGEGEYMTGQTPYDRRVFGIWIGMIDRCYNENIREKYNGKNVVIFISGEEDTRDNLYKLLMARIQS